VIGQIPARYRSATRSQTRCLSADAGLLVVLVVVKRIPLVLVLVSVSKISLVRTVVVTRLLLVGECVVPADDLPSMTDLKNLYVEHVVKLPSVL